MLTEPVTLQMHVCDDVSWSQTHLHNVRAEGEYIISVIAQRVFLPPLIYYFLYENALSMYR